MPKSDLLKTQSKTKAKPLRLNSRSLLVGDYPAKLDLVEHDLDPEVLMHMGKEFVKARKEGRLPRPNILIANNATVEIIDLSTPSFTCEYVALQNLPNLRELYVPADTSLQWLVCVDLPKLKKIEVKSDICWLQLEDVPSLEKVDAKDCARLDHFSIKNAPSLRTVNVSGCKKLKSIRDMDLATQKSLGVARQIKKCQQGSRKDGVIYEGMTYTDTDIVLQSINEGYKIAVAKGMVEEYADHPPRSDEIPQYGFSLMRPLEYVYTGGTGELYTYDAQEIEDDCVLSSMGQHTQEECLKQALRNVVAMGIRLPRNQVASEDKVLAFFHRAVTGKSEPKNKAKTPKKTAAPVSKSTGEKTTDAKSFDDKCQPSKALGLVIGDGLLSRTDAIKKIWEYIKKHGLQDKENARMINTDEKMFAIFGKSQVSMFEFAPVLQRELKVVISKSKTVASS